MRLARAKRSERRRGRRRSRWLYRALAALGLVLLVPCLALAIHAAALDLPAELAGPTPSEPSARRDSLRIVDRTGLLLREVRAGDGKRAKAMALADFGDKLPLAVLAAEDKRFLSHPGVDPVALARAAAQSASEGRVVSGASTITQQLARTLEGAPRTVAGKFRVMALALRIEASLSKERILEEYLNRIEFGPNVRGAEAAAEHYFGKPARDLSLGEAAAVAAIPRGPTLYDPERRAAHLQRRRDRVLDRMQDSGFATADAVRLAKSEPIRLAPRFSGGDASHFAAAVLRGDIDPCAGSASPPPAHAHRVETTLDSDLQREATLAARRTVLALEDRGVSAASVVVLENATGDVLAYVGSPDASDERRLGGNDGVRALRQPGSALKPFVYELAMEEHGLTPATVLPDVELSFSGPDGSFYRPRNYDGRFHGPVLLRDALGNSYNVPAVHVAERVGPARLLRRLRDLGFCSLTREADHYGLALALGDGEVRLLELAAAYATLARGGLYLPPRGVRRVTLSDGSHALATGAAARRVLAEREAALITDMLKDRAARLDSFGEGSALELPFEVAAKTGTSKGFRDNLAVGYTPDVTVAVWVGNFDGSPMRGVSGVTGAAPLLRDVLLAAAHRARRNEGAETPAFEQADGLAYREVCALSGAAPTEHCPHRRRMLLASEEHPAPCEMHGEVGGRLVERLPPVYSDWSAAAGRSARASGAFPQGTVRILYPEEGARIFLEPGARPPTIRVRTAAPEGAAVRLDLDGRPIDTDTRGGAVLALSRGAHTLRARMGGAVDEVRFFVE